MMRNIKNKYIGYLRKRGLDVLADNLIYMIEHNLLDDFQGYLNDLYQFHLTEDGVLGPITLAAIDTALSEDGYVVKKFIEVSNPKQPDIKTILMNFLAEAEGTTIHYNSKTEHSYTSPYGVYKHVFPNAQVIKYIDKLYKKYRLNVNSPRDARIINKYLTEQEKLTIKELAWEFYENTFVDMRIIDVLDQTTALSYLSISVNGGKSRGYKSIQDPIKTKVDGVIGSKTLKKLASFIEDNGYEKLNFGMLEYMYLFYRRLIKRRKSFSIYKNGWYNRLVKTACGLFQKKYKSL